MSAGCSYDGCAIGETGKCGLERDPATCEYRQRPAATGAEVVAAVVAPSASTFAQDLSAPVLSTPAKMAAFPPSGTLGPDVVSELMTARYVNVVGILGDPESGKTACLASLYLMIANAKLTGWSFADSKSLMAFEEIARGARDWNDGQPPDQMTVHTDLSEDWRPGFLHLRLIRTSDKRRVDFALPDLPGEWTTELVGSGRSDRFEFLRAAEVIWLVVDGRALADRERIQGTITRLGQLIARLQTLLGKLPRLLVVVTHRDRGALSDTVLTRVSAELDKRQATATVTQIAPFSETAGVDAGFGIADLIDLTAGTSTPSTAFWSVGDPAEGQRSFMSYRRDR